jgi:hypothetical protein
MTHIHHFVRLACQQALDAHETEFVSYSDALATAQRMYYGNWKTYRQAHGFWGPSDEKRARRYALPCQAARRVFDTDPGIQKILVSRDERLPIYRDKLECIISTVHYPPTLSSVLQEFLVFCNNQYPNAYPWRASFGNISCTFPGRDTWAIWLSLITIWEGLP